MHTKYEQHNICLHVSVFLILILTLACECEDQGSVSPICDLTDGQCECKNNYGGRQCSECEDGYYQFPTCICNMIFITYLLYTINYVLCTLVKEMV